MTNNQRFGAELAVLLTLGATMWAKAGPQEAGKPKALDTLTVRRIEVVDADDGNRTVFNGKEIQILDHNGRVRAQFGLEGGDNNTMLRLYDNRNVERAALTSSFRFAAPSDVR